jgi:hypothetical protein
MRTCSASPVLQFAATADLTAARVALAIAETLWVVCLLWPGDTFERPPYLIMSSLMSEPGWACLFAASATAHWLIVAFKLDYTARAVAFAGWTVFLWWFIVLSIFLTVTPPPAAASGEVALAIAALWILLRSGERRSTNVKGNRRGLRRRWDV